MHFTLSDLVTDIAQNAAESGASRVEMEIQQNGKEFRFIVKDNGKGMSQEELRLAIDPFETDGEKHPGRRVGLGIPFLIQTATQSGGGWDCNSEKNQGTTITAWFDMNNVDTPPIGDLSSMFRAIFLFSGPEEVIIKRSLKEGSRQLDYEVCKSDLIEALGNLEEADSQILLDRYLRSIEDDEEDD